MAKKYIFFLLACFFFILSCSKEPALKEPALWTNDYVLPQGHSSADQQIVQLYNTYGTYFLYDFTKADFFWYFQYMSSSSDQTYYYTPCDTAFVNTYLTFFNQAFLQFYTVDFVKKYMKPYKVLFADTLKFRTSTSQAWSTVSEGSQYCRVISFVGGGGATQIVLARVAPRFTGYSSTIKKAYKDDLHGKYWDIIKNNFTGDIPSGFGSVSDYTTYTAATVASYKSRGFTSAMLTADQLNVTYDYAAYISYLWKTSTTTLTADWNTYPLIKQKSNIVLEHFKSKYGVDIMAIRNYSF